jgi:hypothetical protein
MKIIKIKKFLIISSLQLLILCLFFLFFDHFDNFYLSKESDSGAMLVAEVPLTDSKRSVPLKTDTVVSSTIRKD